MKTISTSDLAAVRGGDGLFPTTPNLDLFNPPPRAPMTRDGSDIKPPLLPGGAQIRFPK